MVTHDNRILDVADRLIHMEDGELESYDLETQAPTRKSDRPGLGIKKF
jgi:putative ABC transport system ATP-binding protein